MKRLDYDFALRMVKARLWECSLNGESAVSRNAIIAWLRRDGLFSPDINDMFLRMHLRGQVVLTLDADGRIMVSEVK